MKNGKPLQVRDEMIKYKMAIPTGRQDKHTFRGPNQAQSPPSRPMQNPSGRSPNAKQMPSNKGAFQRYQNTGQQRQHSERSAKPSVPGPSAKPSSAPSPKAPVSSPPNTKPSRVPKAQIPTSKTFTATVLWFNHPGSFFVQPKDFIQQAMNLYEALRSIPDDPQPGYRPTVGATVVAKYENEWCRAVVETLTGDAAKVMFYDYGNVETVPLSVIRQMPDKIQAMPVYVIHCGIAGVMPTGGKKWSQDVIEMMKPKVRRYSIFHRPHHKVTYSP